MPTPERRRSGQGSAPVERRNRRRFLRFGAKMRGNGRKGRWLTSWNSGRARRERRSSPTSFSPSKRWQVPCRADRKKKRTAEPDQLRDTDEDHVRRILALVRARTGHDFRHYKKSTLLRRITRRAQVTRREGFSDYYTYLRENVEEVPSLFNDLLMSVTIFFRDPQAFDALARQVPPMKSFSLSMKNTALLLRNWRQARKNFSP